MNNELIVFEVNDGDLYTDPLFLKDEIFFFLGIIFKTVNTINQEEML